MSDLIDRQAAIMALVFSDDTGGITCEQMAKVLDVIKALPSAQPSATDTNVGGNLIDRKAAIDAVTAYLKISSMSKTLGNMTSIPEILDQLPSAEPERKKGKWISTDDGWDGEYFVCSECGCPWTLIEGSPEDNGMNFCPNCGAYMRGEQDG